MEETINIDLVREESEVRKLEVSLDSLRRTVEREKSELEGITLELGRTQQAQEIVQLISQAVQQQVHNQISHVVSSCLRTVFGEDAYEFKIEFDRKRGKTEANLRFVRGDQDYDPLTASGGGAIDVAVFALRVASLVLHRPRLTRLVVLDEPFKYVSVQYRENVREMLEGLAKDMDLQIIMVTHAEDLETGKIIEI